MDMSISDQAWVAMNEYENKIPKPWESKKENSNNQFLSQGHLDTAEKIFSMSMGVGQNTDIWA